MGNREKGMVQEKSAFRIGKLIKVILIIIAILIICTAVFAVFKVKIDAKAALRDAKNVRMALQSADIEMYGEGKCIYDPKKKNGIAEGVKEKAEKIYVSDGTYAITSYNKSKHELTGMTFKRGRYTVYYLSNGYEEAWDVDYILRIYSFKGEPED